MTDEYAFSVYRARVKVGTQVLWVNNGQMRHTVMAEEQYVVVRSRRQRQPPERHCLATDQSAILEARGLYQRALEMDPAYAAARAGLGADPSPRSHKGPAARPQLLDWTSASARRGKPYASILISALAIR